MSRRLVLLRHGETEHNRTGRAQGHLDVPLNDRGLAQARAVAPVIAGFRPAFVVCSDLIRARVTAEIVAQSCGVEAEPDPRLRELNVGINRQDRTWQEYAAEFPEEAAELRSDLIGNVPGRESLEQLLDRFAPAMQEAFARVPDNGTGVLVAHGGALRVAIADFLGLGATGGDVLGNLGNCGWVEMLEGTSVFAARGHRTRWRLQGWNLQTSTSTEAGSE